MSRGKSPFVPHFDVPPRRRPPKVSRRKHRVFLTKRTEYHLRGDECVGVRDRGTGMWLLDHAALRLRALTVPPMGHGSRWIGHRLQFWGSNTDVLTSPVIDVYRPELDAVSEYVSQARAGGFDVERGDALLQTATPLAG